MSLLHILAYNPLIGFFSSEFLLFINHNLKSLDLFFFVNLLVVGLQETTKCHEVG